MVNFRFHLVSITAVFLALAAGITIGAGVVDRATVAQIERQLSDVDQRRKATNDENDQLRQDLARWGTFSEQAGDRLVSGQLVGLPVLLVSTSGTDRALVNGFRAALVAAGAEVDATIWFTDRWSLDGDDVTRQLAGVLDAAPTTNAEALRQAGVAGVATAWAVGDRGPLVTSLVDAGFLEVDAPAPPVPVAELPRADSIVVIVSSSGSDLPAGDVAVPLASRLASSQVRVLAAEPVAQEIKPEKTAKASPAALVASLRGTAAVSGRLSTVDNLDDYRGRVAAVLALRQLREGKTGHYGFGSNVRLVPEPSGE